MANEHGIVRAFPAVDFDVAMEVASHEALMGVPFFKIKDLCRQGNVAVFSSNYALYGDMSRRMNSGGRDSATARPASSRKI